MLFSSSINCISFESYNQRFQNNVDLKYGGKIVLPHRCLNDIVVKCQGELPNPMLFKLINKENKTFTHCGVHDFSNSTDAFLPDWVFSHLRVSDPAELKIELSTLPIGKYARLKPMNCNDFKNIAEPIVVLEICLRQYCCLTVNDIISIFYNKKIHRFKVEELKPANAVNIIECDMNVEFSTEEDVNKSSKSIEEDSYIVKPEILEQSKFISFAGKGQRLDGKKKADSIHNRDTAEIPRGIPNYDYVPGTLNFYRRGAFLGEKQDMDKSGLYKSVLQPFSGKGMNLKQ